MPVLRRRSQALLRRLRAKILALTLKTPSFAAISAIGDALTADGTWWSQAADFDLLDVSNGRSPQCLVALVQTTGPTNEIYFSNDAGATWASAGVAQGSITRGAMAYDPVGDQLHVCFVTTPANGGAFHRRFKITRATPGNTSTAIASIARDAAVNLVFDSTAADSNSYEHPWIYWLPTGGNGTLLCGWSVGSSTSTTVKSEARTTMRRLSNSAADNTPANWLAPLNEASGAGATAEMTVAPVAGLKWSKLAKGSAATAFASVYVIPSSDPTYPGDLVVVYSLDGATWRVNRAQWSAANSDWRTGMASATLDTGLATLVAAIGLGTGYNLKNQLGTRIVRDPATGKLCFGYPYWDATGGDRVAFKWFTPAGVADAERVVYDPGGAHSYAPTIDVLWDATAARLVVMYIKTTTQFVYLQTWTPSGTTPSQAETLVEGSRPYDIPTMAAFRVGGKLAVFTRETSAGPPYTGYFGTMVWG